MTLFYIIYQYYLDYLRILTNIQTIKNITEKLKYQIFIIFLINVTVLLCYIKARKRKKHSEVNNRFSKFSTLTHTHYT